MSHLFEAIGGEFLTTTAILQSRINQLQAVFFDWDGVFNNGTKGKETGSLFAEPDAAGTNYLRFGLWLLTGNMPTVFIITGENNPSAFHLAQREHFNGVCFGFTEKIKAFKWLQCQYGIEPQQTAFAFDDVLDLALAAQCGVRLMVRRKASPLFTQFVKQQQLADYITGSTGGENAVREICELILGLGNCYEQVFQQRIAFSEHYQQFLALKKAITPVFVTQQGKQVVVVQYP
ncbi:MAG: phosphatase [Cytophagales bacterium]|nr:phosphatase [Bernardetiaceae bacterium]MDW8205960.1 phosphatase [Cytophagales bacterium]